MFHKFLLMLFSLTVDSNQIVTQDLLGHKGQHSEEFYYVSSKCNETDLMFFGQRACMLPEIWFNIIEKKDNSTRKAALITHHLTIKIFPLNSSNAIGLAERVLQTKFRWTPSIFIFWPQVFATENEILYSIEKVIQNESIASFDINSEVFLVFQVQSDTSTNEEKSVLSVWELYEFKGKKKFLKLQIDKDFQIQAKAVRRENFQLAELSVVALDDPDYKLQMTMTEDEYGNIVFQDGLCLHLLKALECALNFTYKAVRGEGWVEVLENGTWTGMARQIMSGDAELSVAMSSLVDYRTEKLTFLMPAMSTKILAYFRQPQLSTIRDILTGAFTSWLWISFIAMWMFIILVFKVFLFVQAELNYVDETDEEIVKNISVYSVSSISQQGWYQTPQSISIRVVFIISTVVSLVCYIALSAALVSNLSTEVIPIKTFADLTHSQLTVLGDMWVPHSHHYIRDVYKTRKKSLMPAKEQFVDADTGLHKILTTPAAYLTFFDAFATVFRRSGHLDHFYCRTISTVPVTKAQMPSGMFIDKGSPYKEMFNHKIVKIGERGISFKLTSDYRWAVTEACSTRSAPFHISLGINDVFTAYIIFIIGYVLSLILFVIERFFGMKKQKHI